ncbi:hypothetical protein [Rubrivirga sp. IMCC45206]|uniref:hypothetical protein n=1 Tax=Rubrivirga sp. IMCC45206 TaxID=3391614 RepID=UPI0039902309
MRRIAALLVVLAAGCAPVLPEDAPAETRHDLVRALLAHGWTTEPLQAVRPQGVIGEGTAYIVEGRTLVVYDYASAAQAARAVDRDAVLLRQRAAGQGVRVFRRPTLVVLKVGRERTAFDLQLERVLAGPLLAARR